MAAARYTASKSPTKDNTGWVISFRHPLKKDPRGRQGRKMRRGLGTPDEAKAQALVDEMNVLLGDDAWHRLERRKDAERKFDPIVIRAFYDDMDAPVPVNSWDVRNEVMPLPKAEDGYTRVMLVGTTGAGKTSLLRQLIGSDPERDRFPSTSASRTTISDTEIITSDEPVYRAVVTFFSETMVHTNVHECVAGSCATLWDSQSNEKLAEKLLTHRDLRFRLNYILGSWKSPTPRDDEVDDGWGQAASEVSPKAQDAHAEEAAPSTAEREKMAATIAGYLPRIEAIAKHAKRRLQDDYDLKIEALTGRDKDAAQDIFEEMIQEVPEFDELVNDIMDEIQLRFNPIRTEGIKVHANGWPKSWEFKSLNRQEFIRVIRRFSSNYAPAFGTLLTPLVDGIRICGMFYPSITDERAKLVLLDGEGLGHADDPASGIASRISKRFADVDVILLVDSAKAPMLDAPTSLLRGVASSGHQKKLAMAFTHFDLLKDQANLPTFDAQRSHVLSSVRQKLVLLRDVVGAPAVRLLERELDKRSFMLGYLDKQLSRLQKGPVKEVVRLLAFIGQSILPESEPQDYPIYDTTRLVLAIQAATTDFHTRWDSILGFKPSGNIRTAHWAEIKALNRRVALSIGSGEYADLKPVADFVGRLAESITIFLEKPVKWRPGPQAPNDGKAEAAIARIQRAVHTRLFEFTESKLLRMPRSQWVEAFSRGGKGSTQVRARDIRTIYDTAAPIPGPAFDEISEGFLREMRSLVNSAISEGGGELTSEMP